MTDAKDVMAQTVCEVISQIQKATRWWPFEFGGDEEDRTPDLRIANATLSQLSYVPTEGADFTGEMRPRTGHRLSSPPWK